MPEFNDKFRRQTLTLAEVEALPEFKGKLNEQQQNFVRHYVNSGGDQFFAFQNSYSAPNVETCRRGSYSVVQRKSVKTVIDLFLMRTPREIFIEEIDRVLRGRNPKPSKMRALELKAQMLFGVDIKSLRKKFETEVSEEKSGAELPVFDPNGKYEVGTLVMYQNRAIEITAVNSEGRATDYEWAGDPQSPVSW
jgi:hypothetical protein